MECHEHNQALVGVLRACGATVNDARNPIWNYCGWQGAVYNEGFDLCFGSRKDAWIWQPPHCAAFGKYCAARENGKQGWRWRWKGSIDLVPSLLDAMRLVSENKTLMDERGDALSKAWKAFELHSNRMPQVAQNTSEKYAEEVSEMHVSFENSKDVLQAIFPHNRIEHHLKVSNEHGQKSTLDFVLWNDDSKQALVAELKINGDGTGLMECREQVRVLRQNFGNYHVSGLFVFHQASVEVLGKAAVLLEIYADDIKVASYERLTSGMKVNVFLNSSIAATQPPSKL